MMVIKEATKSDIGILVDIIRKSFREVAERFELTAENCPTSPAFYTKKRIKIDFEKGLRYYTLEQDGKICGCVALEKASPDICYLERLAVLPEQRRKGYGTALVNHVFERVRQTGAEQVEIGIIAEDANRTNWYKRFGFVHKGTKKFDHLPFVVAFMSAKIK
jgi:ribosomal protein S18 acetylase RimI-like enzyme